MFFRSFFGVITQQTSAKVRSHRDLRASNLVMLLPVTKDHTREHVGRGHVIPTWSLSDLGF